MLGSLDIVRSSCEKMSFVIFMDTISWCSLGLKSVQFGDLSMRCQLFPDDVLLVVEVAKMISLHSVSGLSLG